jgi:hypothetical protein
MVVAEESKMRLMKYSDKEDLGAYKKLDMFERRLKFLIEDTPHELKMPLWIESASGLGKTTRVRDYVEKELGRKAHVLYLATQDIGDLVGLMTETDKTTTWLRPSWLAQIKEGDVLVFDEFNRAPTYIINAVMSVLLENKLHTHDLPKNVQKIALCNIDDGDYQVTTLTDPAILSRFIRIKYELGITEWATYAKKIGVDEAMIDAVTRETNMLGNNTGKHYDMKFYPNGRGATMIGKLLNIPEALYDSVNGYELASAVLGGEFATIYDKARNSKLALIDVKILVKDYKAVKPKVTKALSDKDMGLIDQLNRKIILWMKENVNANVNGLKDEMDNIAQYIIDLPDGSSVAFFKMLEKDLPDTIYTKVCQYFALCKFGKDIFKKVKTDFA